MVSDTQATRRCSSTCFRCVVEVCGRDNAIYDFSKKAVENGLDIFRVFDSLNYFGKLYSELVTDDFLINDNVS